MDRSDRDVARTAVGAVNEGVNKLEVSNIPLLEKRGGRAINKMDPFRF